MKSLNLVLSMCLLLLLTTALCAESSEDEYLGILSETQTAYHVDSGTDTLVIRREMTPCAKNKGFIQPLIPAKGVTLIAETEMLHALNEKDAIIVDMRLEYFFLEETIPKAINIPYTEIGLHLDQLGCTKGKENWDCTKAVKLYAFCNGPVCTQSPIGIRDIIRLGFPAEKIFYYRGGMLVWSAVGLTTVKGEF